MGVITIAMPKQRPQQFLVELVPRDLDRQVEHEILRLRQLPLPLREAREVRDVRLAEACIRSHLAFLGVFRRV